MISPGKADNDSERAQLVELAMRAIERTGENITRAALAKDARIPRARIDAIFPTEDDLFDAILEQWYAPDIAIMEEVVASGLPVRRKFYEFFARRFIRERARFHKDPAVFAVYCEIGTDKFENVRGYIDLADHYLSELIAQAQEEGYFAGLGINRALSLINQMVNCYTSPQMMLIIEERLAEDKLATIIDTLFDGLSAEARGAAPVAGLRIA
jgi:AcrR family transcriptional regulator